MPGRVPVLMSQGLSEERRAQIQNYLVGLSVHIV